MNNGILMERSIGFVLLDSSVWSDKFRPIIAALKVAWRTLAGQSRAMDGTGSIKLLQSQKRFSGTPMKLFMLKCDELAPWMSTADEELVS